MEFVRAPTLHRYVTERRAKVAPVSASEAAAIGKELLTGVAVMHGHNIIHRDLKPGNLFVEHERGQWRVKITDLGILDPLWRAERGDRRELRSERLTLRAQATDAARDSPLHEPRATYREPARAPVPPG